MSKCKTSYSIKWEEQFGWLRKAKEPDSAIWSLCNKTFRIDRVGLAQGKSHQKSKSHWEKESTDPNQRTCVIGTKKSIALSFNNKKAYLESSNSANIKVCWLKLFISQCMWRSRQIRVMFPDSDIAENYHQIIAKIKYNIQFGITPFIK